MAIKKAKRNPVEGVTTFYVPSRSIPGKQYMVLRFEIKRNPLYICQCNDSFFCSQGPWAK